MVHTSGGEVGCGLYVPCNMMKRSNTYKTNPPAKVAANLNIIWRDNIEPYIEPCDGIQLDDT